LIISHKYKYLFIEIPETASWAIRKELCKNYNGEPTLHKHASYIEYCRNASKNHLAYFVFATVRNPLDCLVSRYIKLKFPKVSGSTTELIDELIADYSDFKKHQDVHKNNLSFGQYFQKYHKRPISEMIDFSADRLDYVIRYENLQDDFSKVLKMLKIDQVGIIPVLNKSKGKNKPYLDYYEPEIVAQAKHVCGPFMKKWGYDFPNNWGSSGVTFFDEIQYVLLTYLKKIYMTNIRYNNAPYSKAIRRLYAKLFSS
jgi:hypothetical protein